MFATVCHLHPRLLYAGKARASQSGGSYMTQHCLVSTLPTNIKLGWKVTDNGKHSSLLQFGIN